MTLVRNPVLPGLHPDPSLCRHGDEYFLVVSSFGYWPAIPVFRSTDLAHWTPIGHVVDRVEQLDLHDADLSDGVWAPTIRFHDGEFFLVVTIAKQRTGERTLLFTTTDPAGDWSDPIDLDATGIDPSLLFDDDGRAWLTLSRDAENPELGPAEITLQEFDPRSRRLVGDVTVIWRGFARDTWVEAPHLYRSGNGYLLLGAEGGTERNHAVTAAVSEHIEGPYRSDPRNPLLTHRHLGAAHPIQNVGHADLVDTPSGETWALVLGTRPVHGHHVLGRETFLVPAVWDMQGLVLAPGDGQVPDRVEIPGSGPTSPGTLHTDRFDGDSLAADWLSLRGPLGERAATRARSGAGLRLRSSSELGAVDGTPAFLGRRQQHHRFSAAVTLRPDGLVDAAAGIAVVQSEHRFVSALLEQRTTGDFQVRVTLRADGENRVLGAEPVPQGASWVRLVVDADERAYRIAVETDLDAGTRADPGIAIDTRLLSTESGGGFVGVVLGPYVEGRGSAGAAVLEQFDYRGVERSCDDDDAAVSDGELRYSVAP
ncbi:glycoside hydrolase family 43 protein [Plantibacter flavus]|uniref:glycoside hydrolase family 43 protein n=1 Tax=Plantibacter flavus TaxID=150123 RepID=UPI003F153DF9